MNTHDLAEENLFLIGCAAARRARGATLQELFSCEEWPED